MHKKTLIAGALLALAAPAAAQWSDNFESYSANQSLSNVGGWFGWDNTPAAAASVDATRSRSFPNSLLVGGTTDAVHPQIGATHGKWTLSAWQYIAAPLTQDVYFIVNNVYNHGGPYSWTGELKCDFATGTVIDDLRLASDIPQPIVFDQWVEFRMDIDLDANTVSNYYNGSLISSGVYAATGARAIENIDLFSTGGVCNWDDIALEWRGDGFETYAAATALDNVGGWFGWDNTPSAAGTVDATRARTGVNSMFAGTANDAVHPEIGITSGRWSVTAWQYIPSPLTADVFFILNNVYNHGGPYTWTVELQCDVTTGMVVDDLRSASDTPQPIVLDQWAEFRFDIDLDANTITSFYNGAQVSQGVYAATGPRAIQNIDLFNNGGICSWDDVSFTQVTPAPCYETNLGTALALGDDQTVAQPLGFTFPFPGGSTTDISICSNGFIWLDGVQTSADFSNSVAEFLGSAQATPRIAAAWRDFNPGDALSDDVYFNTFPDRAVITWHNVVTYQGTQPMTVQCQLLADGTVYVFYDANYDLAGGTFSEGRTLTGIKAGAGLVVDPGITDFSNALPIQTTGSTVYEFFADAINFDLGARCARMSPNTLGGYDVSFRADCGASATSYGAGCPAVSPITLGASAPPVLGTTFTFDVTNVPATATAVVLVLALGNDNLSLAQYGWPGCSSYTALDFFGAMPFTPPTASLSCTVPTTPEGIGSAIYSQAVVIENSNLYASNGLMLILGKN